MTIIIELCRLKKEEEEEDDDDDDDDDEQPVENTVFAIPVLVFSEVSFLSGFCA